MLKPLVTIFLVLGLLGVQGCLFSDPPVAPYKTSAYWSTRSATGGSVSAQKMLGAMYYHGDGVTKDLKKAYVWYKLAADQGDSSAQKFVNLITAAMSQDEMADAQKAFLSQQSEINHAK